jgi:hypothetical protein
MQQETGWKMNKLKDCFVDRDSPPIYNIYSDDDDIVEVIFHFTQKLHLAGGVNCL